MTVTRYAKTLVVGATTAALALSGAAAANAADDPYAPQPTKPAATVIQEDGKVTVSFPPALATLVGKTITASCQWATVKGKVKAASNGATATLNVTKLLPKTAGKYKVTFKAGTTTFTKTYTVGKAVEIKAVKAKKTKAGATITGKIVKNAQVRVQVLKGERVVGSALVKANANGVFTYKFEGTAKGTYDYKVTVMRTTKYYGAASVFESFKK